MTRAEAKRQVLLSAAALLDGDDGQGWLHENNKGEELSEADTKRRFLARDELAAELRRRARNRQRDA